MRTTIVALLLVAVIALTTRAHEPASATPPSIQSAAFLAGVWQSDSPQQGFNEEIWSAPRGNNIMGCFRWLKPDGSASLVELLSITAEDNTLTLRLRHHNAKLEGWKAEVEVNKPLELVLKESAENKLVFHPPEGSTQNNGIATALYERTGETLRIELAFTDPKREKLGFDLKRAD
jgi:hypothetical protein